jgi:hypothetical protein
MKPVDYLKALVLAFVVLVVEFSLSYLVVAIYAAFIAPGHPYVFYRQAAIEWLVPWWIHIGGTLIFFFVGWLFTGRQRGRNAYLFVAAMCGFYLAIDLGGFALMIGLWSPPTSGPHVGSGIWTFVTSGALLWMAVQFAAAFLGAYVELRSGEAPGSA